MLRLNGIVLSIATLLAAAPALAAPEASLIDQLDGSNPAMVFVQHPDLARFSTIGSPDGTVFASLSDETAAAIARVQTMMSDVDTGWSEVVEARVLVTSDTDRAEATRLIAADSRLAALPVSYRLVEQLSAPRAKFGLDVVVISKTAVETMSRRYGPGSPSTN